MRPYRKSMKPWRLEMLLFLRMNKHLWDVHDVHACLKGEEAAAVAEVRDGSGGCAMCDVLALDLDTFFGEHK